MAALAAVALAAACALPELPPRVRVVSVAPSGAGVDPAAVVAVDFSGEVDPAGLLDGRRALLAREADLRAALAAVESEAGADASVPRVGCAASLEAGATRLLLRPLAPLRDGERFVVVLSSLATDPDGRGVLDADGAPAPTVARFETALAPPPAVLLTELRADAETPEAGGEYAEVLNLGPGPLDLAGWRFEKQLATGSWSGCTVGEAIGDAAGAPAPAGRAVLVVGGSWDGRYALPEGTAVFPCGATSLAGGIANDRPPVVRLLDRAGAVAALLDASAVPLCAAALLAEAIDLVGATATCCSCTEGSPGAVP